MNSLASCPPENGLRETATKLSEDELSLLRKTPAKKVGHFSGHFQPTQAKGKKKLIAKLMRYNELATHRDLSYELPVNFTPI